MHLGARPEVESVQAMSRDRKEPASPEATETRVFPGTRVGKGKKKKRTIPSCMMHYLRNVDWTKTSECACPVYYGHNAMPFVAKLALSVSEAHHAFPAAISTPRQ